MDFLKRQVVARLDGDLSLQVVQIGTVGTKLRIDNRTRNRFVFHAEHEPSKGLAFEIGFVAQG